MKKTEKRYKQLSAEKRAAIRSCRCGKWGQQQRSIFQIVLNEIGDKNHGFAKEVKLAGKPGSVVDSHSSRRFVT